MKTMCMLMSLSALTLAGCSGSGSSVVGASQGATSSIPASLVVEYDDATDTLILTDGVSTSTSERAVFYDSTDFLGYIDLAGTGFTVASLAETASGGGRVATFVSWPSVVNVRGTVFERIGDTDMPDAGSSTYTGSYIAWLSTDADFEGFMQLAGDASFDINFGSSTIEGTITNREDNLNAMSDTFGDLFLELTSISGGGFSGTTSGGVSSVGGSSVSAGEYEGMFTGPNGEEVIGGVVISHNRGGTAVTETGAFIAD